MSDEEESFLVPSGSEGPQKEKMWCKIGEKGNLEYVDWEMIENFSKQFDAFNPDQRTEQMLIAKLMWLVREETIKEFSHAD